jgi:hypothetical protein
MSSKSALIAVGVIILVAAAAAGVYFYPRLAAPASAPAAVSAPSVATPAEPPDLIALASTAVASCTVATPPPVPDASKATLAQMQAADSAFKAYDATTIAYYKCVDAAVADLASKYKGTATDSDLQDLNRFGTRAHNTAVEQEQAQADLLNTQIRLYKAKHPHG